MTDNTSMLERMAERIEAAFAKQGGGYALDTDWTEVARAALQAIREPSREQSLAMSRALIDNWPKLIGDDVCVNGRLSDATYKAAIDAILSESPTNG